MESFEHDVYALRPQRPRLAEALSVVSGVDSEEFANFGAPLDSVLEVTATTVRIRTTPHRVTELPLSLTDPGEAWEAFEARGLIARGRAGDPSFTVDVTTPCQPVPPTVAAAGLDNGARRGRCRLRGRMHRRGGRG